MSRNCSVGHAGVGGGDDDLPVRFGKFGYRLTVARNDRFERLLVLPFRVLGSKLSHPVERKHGLRIQRVGHPKGAVLVEGGDAFLRPDVLRVRLVRCIAHKLENGFFRRAVVPRGERVGRV